MAGKETAMQLPDGSQNLIIEILRAVTAMLLLMGQWLKNRIPRNKS